MGAIENAGGVGGGMWAGFGRGVRVMWRNRLLGAGVAIVVGLGVLAVGSPWMVRWGWLLAPEQQFERGLDADGVPREAGGEFVLGTDHLGRDVLSRVLHGTRVSLSVGVAAMGTATVLGVAMGLVAGYYGGKRDWALMRFTEMNLAVPAILLAVAFAGLMDGRVVHVHPAGWGWHFLDVRLERGVMSLFVVIGLVCWPGMVRVVRAQVLALKEREFVQAARALGASNRRIIFRHLLPNLLPTVIVLSAMNTANAILLEAGLGYLGIGVPPPVATWGSMIADGQAYFVAAPHIVLAPGVAIVVTVLGFNLLGQGLQEELPAGGKERG